MHWYINYPEAETLFVPMQNVNFSYPAHLHGCLEISFCVQGELEVTIGGQLHTLLAGQGVLIPPNTVHSYHTPVSSSYYTILFSRSLLPDLASLLSHKTPKKYLFSLDENLMQQLSEYYNSQRSLFGGKSILYRAAEAFIRDNSFTPTNNENVDTIVRIVSYIQEHMTDELTLQDVADHLGYSYFYTSKQIRRAFGATFTNLLAQYRVANAKFLMNNGNTPISQVALSCGFGSIRSFNRIFLQITGLTPSQYLHESSQLK